MDPAIEKILAVSDRSFLHDVLRDLCMDNSFVRRAVLERFTALPDGPSGNNAGAGDAASSGVKSRFLEAPQALSTTSRLLLPPLPPRRLLLFLPLPHLLRP
ncbi:hypothetical protein PG994_002615 [Apiospora phragmitis]|uniref:Uncharacterized protein n=1 Tax=Apiospora phragmitis TaxID=2905665 RepID=A0ABR1W5M0_9PEZI